MVLACAGVVLFFTLTQMHQLKTLRGLLPICVIQDNGGDWRPVERDVKEHSERGLPATREEVRMA